MLEGGKGNSNLKIFVPFSRGPNSFAKLVNLTGFDLEFSDKDCDPEIGGMKLKLNVSSGEARSPNPNFTTDFVPLAVGVNGTPEALDIGGWSFVLFVDVRTFVGVSGGDCVRVVSCVFEAGETNMEFGGDGSP